MRDLIVIPRDGEKSNQFFQKKIPESKKNIDLLNEYIKENSVDLYEETSMYIQGVLMAMMGYCIVEINGINFNAYIPRKITEEQYEWFDKNKEEISRCYISAEIMDEQEGIIQIRKHSSNGSPLIKLYNRLDSIIEVKRDEINDTRRIK